MTQEEKDLLLQDLCARLPYGVILNCCNLVGEKLYTIDSNGLVNNDYDLEEVKPCLFPLSAMTEWQERELEILMKNSIESCGMLFPYDCLKMERFFNENHLDWRGLIPMGLANDATGLNIY